MNFKSALLTLCLLPAVAFAQPAPPENTRNTFLAAKIFEDGNPGDVDVTLSCTTGLPISQTKSLEPLFENGEYVDFVVVEFDSGELNCEITEDVPNGYEVLYIFGQTDLPLPVTSEAAESMAGEFDDIDFSEDGCLFENVLDETQTEGEFFCLIINFPAPVEVVIDKVWMVNTGDELNGVSGSYDIELNCDGDVEITDTTPEGDVDSYGNVSWEVNDSDPTDRTFTAMVRPLAFGENDCEVIENIQDSAVEVDNTCEPSFDIDVAGGPYQCTVTNTVFFEGIPTLNPYGLAILVLVMLGVGFVGFRRFA